MKISVITVFLKKYRYSILSGVLLLLCFPGFNLSFIAWFALVPFLFSILTSNNRIFALKSGLLTGTILFFGTQYWIYHSINHFGNIPFVSSISIVLLLSLYQGFYIALFGFLTQIYYGKHRSKALLLTPFLWSGLEYIKSFLFTGFPWTLLGHSQFTFLHIIQIVDITGVYGISFLILFSNTVITEVLLYFSYLWGREKCSALEIKTIKGHVIILFIIFFVVLTYGGIRLNSCSQSGDRIKISIIQGNIEQNRKWNKQYKEEVVEIYKSLTMEALKEGPRLVVWPETSLPFFFGTEKDYTGDLRDFQKKTDSYLLFGTVLIKESPDRRALVTNSSILLSSNGKTVYNYDKIHLVPFGEYVPFRKLFFFINKIVESIGDFAPGTNTSPADTKIGKFAVPVCYEIIFPRLVGSFYKNGGDFMVNITNDAWFGKTNGPHQHFIISIFRAIENRKPLIRAANTGISGFVDTKGRIIANTGLFERKVLTCEIVKNNEITIYTSYGDVFAQICNILNVFFLFYLFLTRRKENYRK